MLLESLDASISRTWVGVSFIFSRISCGLHKPQRNIHGIKSLISLEPVAETLRLGLVSFGVDVLEVITVAVKALGQTYFDLKLPAEFLHESIKDTFVSRAQGNGQLPKTDIMEYATADLYEITKRITG